MFNRKTKKRLDKLEKNLILLKTDIELLHSKIEDNIDDLIIKIENNSDDLIIKNEDLKKRIKVLEKKPKT